jgi:hypothetical protein
MNKFIVLSCFILILGNVRGQDIPPSLANSIKVIGMTYTPSERYTVTPSQNIFGENTCSDETCPLRRLKLVHAKFTHQDGQCKVYIYASGADRIFLGFDKKSIVQLNHPAPLSFNRIKSNFMYGRYEAATAQETKDLDMMLTHYPQENAKALFNADYMVGYPYNMEGKKCEERFSSGRAIVTGKGGLDVFIYFFFTEQGADHFDKYLSDFKKTLWFND